VAEGVDVGATILVGADVGETGVDGTTVNTGEGVGRTVAGALLGVGAGVFCAQPRQTSRIPIRQMEAYIDRRMTGTSASSSGDDAIPWRRR